jgi:hypothetical protein
MSNWFGPVLSFEQVENNFTALMTQYVSWLYVYNYISFLNALFFKNPVA